MGEMMVDSNSFKVKWWIVVASHSGGAQRFFLHPARMYHSFNLSSS